MVEAKLFELQVSLNSSGQVITEFNYIERDNLITALDGWRKDYPNTHVLGSIVDYLKGVGHDIEKDVGKLCKT